MTSDYPPKRLADGITTCLGKDFAALLPADRGPTRNQWLYHARRIEKHVIALSDASEPTPSPRPWQQVTSTQPAPTP